MGLTLLRNMNNDVESRVNSLLVWTRCYSYSYILSKGKIVILKKIVNFRVILVLFVKSRVILVILNKVGSFE